MIFCSETNALVIFVVHIGNVCQTATIVDMEATSLHTNDCSVVTLVFLKQPEYVTVGSRLLFRERKTKGIGQVILS